MHNYFILTDEELFDLIKQDQQLAFNELYNRYKKPMVGLALKLDDDDAVEDIVHDLFIKLWTNRENIQINQQFKSYIYRALRNKILDYFAHQLHERKYLDSLRHFGETFVDSADFHIREKQFLVELDRLMDKYPPQDKIILKMRMDGYTNTEIADHLGLSEKTI